MVTLTDEGQADYLPEILKRILGNQKWRKKLKAKQKKQKQPAETKLQKTSIQYKKDVFLKLQNMADITGRHDYELVDQALRKFFGMATPTIEDEINGAK